MTEFEVYRHYLALKLHFTTDQYDVIKQQGRVRASKQAFYKRKDLLSIKRIANTFRDQDIVNFLVANFVSGDRWGGLFDTEAKERYVSWKKRIESITYTFKKEIDKLRFYCEKNELPFDELFSCKSGQHPYIVKAYLRGDMSIETLVILNKINNYTDELDKQLSGDLVWPDLSRLIKKYMPFLTINKEKYDAIFRGRD